MTTDTKTPNLDTLRELNRQLKVLLDDPHPGLASWTANVPPNNEANRQLVYGRPAERVPSTKR